MTCPKIICSSVGLSLNVMSGFAFNFRLRPYIAGKLRIKDGIGHGGNDRIVFTDDGESMKPLEALGVRDQAVVPSAGAYTRPGFGSK